MNQRAKNHFKKEIVDLYCWIRKNNSHTPDDVVDFMYKSALKSLEEIEVDEPELIPLKIDDTVKIINGWLEDKIGYVEELPNSTEPNYKINFHNGVAGWFERKNLKRI